MAQRKDGHDNQPVGGSGLMAMEKGQKNLDV